MFALLRRLLLRPSAPPIQHTLVCGATRSGKSEAELTRLVPLARRGDCAIVLMDPPGSLAQKFLLQLDALGLTDRVLYDRLSETQQVLGYAWLSPSAHPDPLQREAENDERVREFAAVLLRRRGIQDAAMTPVIEEGLLAALRLFLAQQMPVPLPWLAEVFDQGSPHRARMLANCQEPELLRKFLAYASLSPSARRSEVAPAERILRGVLTSPAFRVRSGEPTFDLGNFLDDRGILILDGSSRGNLSRDAASVMMGAVTLQVIRHCRTGAKGRVVLALDEAINAGLIGLYESQAIAEAAKWNLEFHVLVQDLFGFASEQIRSNILQNCWRHEWFRQGSPEAAELAAEDIGVPLLDPLRVHHIEERIQMVDAGYERVQTENRSEWTAGDERMSRGVSWQTVLWPRRREVRDAQKRFITLQDQIALMRRELMILGPGYRFVRAETVTRASEYVPMLYSPRSMFARQSGMTTPSVRPTDEIQLARILAMLKRRPEYQTPSDRAPQPQPNRRSAARALANGMLN